ncbi:MAG: AAA family ATPase, partial [Acidobacteria bacterium]|nr:AAA family ATPase [Acidobacteriota bacterium]
HLHPMLQVPDDLPHKYSRWRNYLKGIYDSPGRKFKILVTGSARLDLYRRGGDSLQGRYHHLTLFPLSFAEIKGSSQKDVEQLLRLGGFPEPFLSGSEAIAKRWSLEYGSRVVRDDIRDLEQVVLLDQIELLFHRLPELVGSPLSINAIREDLRASHRAVSSWLNILERLLCIFRLNPFGSPKIRAIRHAQKHYHFDWSVVQEPGARFENMIALHLFKWVTYHRQIQGKDLNLAYARTVRGEEIDFIVTEDRNPVLAVECKASKARATPFLRTFASRFRKCRVLQVTLQDLEPRIDADGIETQPARQFLAELV